MNSAPALLPARRPDLEAIARWVKPQSRVLDLGCGDGTLLRHLWETRAVHGYGVEIDDAKVLACVQNDVNVLQMNLESGLSAFKDASFDYVILSQTLQAVRHTESILREMLRVGREVIVSFPNFGHWNARLQVLAGRMPVSTSLPYVWYDTPNIHLCERLVLHDGKAVHVLPNLRGSLVVYRMSTH